jgi:hypothetical protein
MSEPLSEKKIPVPSVARGFTPIDRAITVAAMSANAHSTMNGLPLKYSLICSRVVICPLSQHKKDKKDNHDSQNMFF